MSTFYNMKKIKLVLIFVMFTFMNLMNAQNGMQLDGYVKLKSLSKPHSRHYYGEDKKVQFADLYLPSKKKQSYPVIALIHGGCWDVGYEGLAQMGAMADSLLNEGFAVWNIEYRCVNYPGGGYPGTYQDIQGALIKLAEVGSKNNLDMDNIIVMGHSAGGHLAIWSAQSNLIDLSSTLHSDKKVNVKSVIGLGSILDLNTAEEACPSLLNVGGVDLLIKKDEYKRANPSKDTSPIAMSLTNVPLVLIHGANDIIAPPKYALDFLSNIPLSENMPTTTLIIVPNATHYDEVSPTSTVWPHILSEINKALE